jgi:hypothetical protein
MQRERERRESEQLRMCGNVPFEQSKVTESEREISLSVLTISNRHTTKGYID